MIRKIKIVISICFLMLLLVGWGKKKIELLDDNKLIDMDKAIEYAKPGGEWKKNENSSDSNKASDIDDQKTTHDKNDNQEDVEIGDSNIKYINVSEEAITYCGSQISKDQLFDLLKRDNGDSIRFVLVDDWAEAHVYREVKAILLEAKDTIGIKFSEEK